VVAVWGCCVWTWIDGESRAVEMLDDYLGEWTEEKCELRNLGGVSRLGYLAGS
jgi:hypothetical protein